MTTLHRFRRTARAVRGTIAHPRRFIRDTARLALQREAAARLTALRKVELVELLGDVDEITLRLPSRSTRHPWSLGAAEQLSLQAIVRTRHYKTAFEFGTFNGGTTRMLAEALPDDGQVWTLDLPFAAFDASQDAPNFSGKQVGRAYEDSHAVAKITQLFGNSLVFDFDPFAASADLVLVDGGHQYEHGFKDTIAALGVVRTGGIIVWDDFEPYWHGLVSGICDAMGDRELRVLAGTALAVYQA